MGKSCKVVVCGQAAVGKTAVLEQLLYANHVAGMSLPYIIIYYLSESNEVWSVWFIPEWSQQSII